MAVEKSTSTRSALVIYGTETGTSQDLAYEIDRILGRHRFDTEVEEFNHVNPTSLSENTLVVFVLSTTGQGDFPSNARKFWTSLLRKKLSSTYLIGVAYAIVGLGDSSYPKFNWAARKLHKRIQQLGASSLLDPCEADEQGEDSTDGAFIAWTGLFKAMLHNTFPLPLGITPVPDGDPLPNRWILATQDDSHELMNSQDGEHNGVTHDGISTDEVHIKATLENNDRVTPMKHWQDVRLLRFKLDRSQDYLPGDALAIRPQNMPEDVNTLLQALNWTEIADVPLIITQAKKSSRSSRMPDQSLNGRDTFTLRQLLTTSLDINAIPRRSFFGAIAQYTQDEMHRERLLEFTDPQYLDEYYDYATRPRRSILEILQEFDSVKIPWQEVINVFPFLRPRQFSIASGGRLKEEGMSIEVLVAIVKYRTVIKRVRQGVCTRYLAQLPVGSKLDVVLKTEGRLHTSQQLVNNNHLLIGAGTGIAPLRAIIHEKRDGGSKGTNFLIFGCRNAVADYFFQEEWEVFEQANVSTPNQPFQVITAFSRDQTNKIYIQDRIREYGAKIRALLLDQLATVVVCGSSGAMPKAVRQALVDVLSEVDKGENLENSMSGQDAEKFLAALEKQGRYKQETW